MLEDNNNVYFNLINFTDNYVNIYFLIINTNDVKKKLQYISTIIQTNLKKIN